MPIELNEIQQDVYNNTKIYKEIIEKQVNNLDLSIDHLSNSSKRAMEQMTIATSIKDRKSFLEQTLPTWIQFPFKNIVILDWGSEPDFRLWVNTIEDKRILYYRVNSEEYNHSMARNIKMGLVEDREDNSNNWILSIDSDIMLNVKFADKFLLNPNSFYAIYKKYAIDGVTGTSIQTKKQFFDVGGCNTDMDSWGYEDLDIYQRLKEKYTWLSMPPFGLYHIPHNDDLRTKYTKIKNKWESNSINRQKSIKKHTFEPKNYEIFDKNLNKVCDSNELFKNLKI